MKQLIQEVRKQFSFSEWFKAFWSHTPTAGKVSIQGGAKLVYPGGTFQERTQAMIRLKKELQNRK
jgi:hypothetical protein